jgi:predicted nuclease of predicted toxin-antitoxin system
MKCFVDENIPYAIVRRLRELGNDVLYASETDPAASDTHWLNLAELENRIILTSDKDFGELIFRDRLSTRGIILLRLDDLPLHERITRLDTAWPMIASDSIGKFIVITPTKVRVRDLM